MNVGVQSVLADFFPFFAYLFIYLVVPGLTCGMENLFSCSTWDLVSQPEVKPGPLQWECRVSGRLGDQGAP